MEIGQANYDKKGSSKIDKVKDGNNIIRIIPPIGSYAKSGKWFQYVALEWGYKDSAGNNRPFQDPSVQNYKSKMWEVDTLARQRRVELEAKHKQAVEMGRSGQLSKEDVEKVKELKEQFNLEKKYYVNAINDKGEIVLFKIGYKAKQALEAEIKKLRDKGVDPLSVDNGRFFNIFRQGSGFDTVYSVSVVSENINAVVNGETMVVQKEVKHVLDETILKRLSTEATDLGTLSEKYPIIEAAQVDAIVKGGPKAVDEILGVYENKKTTAPKVDSAPAQETSKVAQVAEALSKVGASPEAIAEAVGATAAAETKADDAGKLNTASSNATTQQTTSPSETAVPAPTQDKAAFLASLGLPG